MPAGSDIFISFVISAFNEERSMETFLNGLGKVVTPETEVIVGLDGCTDGTAAIVRSHSFANLIEYPERRGKAEVLNDLLGKARGEVVIICDVDWDIIVVPDWIRRLKDIFARPEIGGVVIPTANMPFIDRSYIRKMSLAFTGEAWGSYFLHRYILETQTAVAKDGKRYVDYAKMRYPFTVNICRKSLIGKALSTGDDFERTLQILRQGHSLLFDTDGVFLFRATDINKTLGDMFRQRTRGSIVYRVLEKEYGYVTQMRPFFVRQMLYAFLRLYRLRPRDIIGMALWYLLAIAAFIYTMRRDSTNRSTKDLWALRQNR